MLDTKAVRLHSPKVFEESDEESKKNIDKPIPLR
jgi:hypothetical protein